MQKTVSFEELFNAVENYLGEPFTHNEEVNISHLGLKIDTPSGEQPIEWVVKKMDQPTLRIEYVTGEVSSVAAHHIFINGAGEDTPAIILKKGDVVSCKSGTITVKSITQTGVADCYDIGIPFPHQYYDAQGVLHHNTIITGALSKLSEPFGRTLTIVPSKSLVLQTEQDYRNIGLDVGVYYGDRKDIDKTHTISTWQSLGSLMKKKDEGDGDLTIYDLIEGVNAVIVDECFAPGTKVLTTQGYVSIETIKPGDKVLNIGEDGVMKVDTVVKLHENLLHSASEPMRQIVLETEEAIEVTANHKFLTTGGWIRADDLTPSHKLKTGVRNCHLQIIGNFEVAKPARTYNLHIENDHNYIVEEVVVSNCHTAKGNDLQALLAGPLAHIPLRWGLTGTIPKDEIDQLRLLTCLGPVVGNITAKELMDVGVLAKCHINILQTDDSHVEFKSYQEEKQYLLGDTHRLTWLASKVMELAKQGNTLVLVDRIETGLVLQSMIPDCVFINGSVKNEDRKQEYDSMQNENNKVIIASYGVASTGISINRIFHLVLLEPGKSFVRVIQSIGRGVRVAKDKEYVDVWDVTSNLKFSSRHLKARKAFYKEAKYPHSTVLVQY